MTACLINTGFVGCNHAGLENYRVFIHANALWPFVYTQEMPDTVPCAMEEVHSVIPNRHTSQYIELRTAGSGWEFGHSQCYVSL